MASPQEQVEAIISIGGTMMIIKHFIIAPICVWVYDYLITLKDEIRYAWPGRKSPVFLLFIANRYWPMLYVIWLSIAMWSPSYTRSMCDHTAWLHLFYYVLATVFAQTAITLRVYAVTGKNMWIGACLGFLTFVKFVFSMYLTIRFSQEPAFHFPDVPLEEFQICIFDRWPHGEIATTAISLTYDFLAFAIIIRYSRRRDRRGQAYGMPDLFDRIVKDATIYFLVIFTSHLLLIFFEVFAPEATQLLPASAYAVLVPIMATRLMLSLKEAASPSDTYWSFHDPDVRESLRFAGPTIGGSGRRDTTTITMRDLSTKDSSSLEIP